MSVREQHCDYCGDYLGTFEHSPRMDGPLTCGKPDCERYAREALAEERDRARFDAEQDDYGRYR